MLAILAFVIFSMMQVNATPSEARKINDPLTLKLWNASSTFMHLHNPRCGIAEFAYATVEFNPDNQNYIAYDCRTLGRLMPNAIDFIFGCPGIPVTDRGDHHIKFYYTTDNDQVLDWDNRDEQRVRGDLTVVDTKVDKPDVAHIPVHVSPSSEPSFHIEKHH